MRERYFVQQQSAKQILEQCKSSCEQMKQQMAQQLNTIPDQNARTAFQMAINAVDNCVAQCHTASGVVQ